MKEIFDFFEEVKKKLDENKEFEFWKLLEKAEEISGKIENKHNGKIEKNVVLEGKLFLGKNSVVKAGTRVEGNVFVGSNCVIGPNAFLRNSVLIANNCKVANSEIKASVVLSNSNVPHFSYVGDSILGENVNLGAGTKIANLRFDNANIKVEVAGQKIDSGRRKLGALLGHNVKTGINSSINCGLIILNNQRVFPGEVVKKNLSKK